MALGSDCSCWLSQETQVSPLWFCFFFSFVYKESEWWRWVFKQKNMMAKKKKYESPFTGEKKITGLPGKMWWASSFQLPFPTFYLQKFKRTAKPQVPQNMTVLNYKVKGLILHTVVGSVRRKYYPPLAEPPLFNKNSKLQIYIRKCESPKSLSILWSNFFHFWVVRFLFIQQHSTICGREKGRLVCVASSTEPQGKSDVFPTAVFLVWFNTCTDLAMAKEEKGSQDCWNQGVDSCHAGFREGDTCFGTSLGQVAGLVWHLCLG